MGDRITPVPPATTLGMELAGLSVHDVAQVAMGAAAWAAGMPIAENENLPLFRATVNRVLDAFGLSCDFDDFDDFDEPA